MQEPSAERHSRAADDPEEPTVRSQERKQESRTFLLNVRLPGGRKFALTLPHQLSHNTRVTVKLLSCLFIYAASELMNVHALS